MLDTFRTIFAAVKSPPAAIDLVQGGTPARAFRPGLNPLYRLRPATGTLDADYVHSVVSQAKNNDMSPLLALYRDIIAADDGIQGPLGDRIIAALMESPRVLPARKGNADDQAAADAFQRCLDNSPSFFDGLRHWMTAALWPVAINEVRWIPGAMGFSAFELRPVELERLRYLSGSLRIQQTTADGALTGDDFYPEPSSFIQHRGYPVAQPDQWGGPFRALLFWHLFGACDRDWWARFLERFGAPFLKGTYDADDEESRAVLEMAFAESARMFGIVTTSDTQVEIVEAKNTVGGEQFAKFLEVANDAKRRLICGQTLSAKAGAGNTGGGGAKGLQGEVRSDFMAWDRLMLAQTVRRGLIEPWMRYNRLPGECPKLQWPTDPGDLGMLGQFLTHAASMGLEVDADGLEALNERSGITMQMKPGAPGETSPGLAAAILAGLLPTAQPSLTRNATADLLRALGDPGAEVSRILASSTSRGELESRLAAYLGGHNAPASLAAALTRALTASAANGFTSV